MRERIGIALFCCPSPSVFFQACFVRKPWNVFPGMPEGGGRGGGHLPPPPFFDRSVNPILTKGADYAPQIFVRKPWNVFTGTPEGGWRVGGLHPFPHFLTDQLTLFHPRGQIMPPKFLCESREMYSMVLQLGGQKRKSIVAWLMLRSLTLTSCLVSSRVSYNLRFEDKVIY